MRLYTTSPTLAFLPASAVSGAGPWPRLHERREAGGSAAAGIVRPQIRPFSLAFLMQLLKSSFVFLGLTAVGRFGASFLRCYPGFLFSAVEGTQNNLFFNFYCLNKLCIYQA